MKGRYDLYVILGESYIHPKKMVYLKLTLVERSSVVWQPIDARVTNAKNLEIGCVTDSQNKHPKGSLDQLKADSWFGTMGT